MGYAEKLRDPRWQKKRLAIFNRDGWTCQLCGAADKMLVVHHRYYVGEPWEAPDEALVTWCGECHDREHEAQDVRALLDEAHALLHFLHKPQLDVTVKDAQALVWYLAQLAARASSPKEERASA